LTFIIGYFRLRLKNNHNLASDNRPTCVPAAARKDFKILTAPQAVRAGSRILQFFPLAGGGAIC
jgi:hypothetical protein